MRAQAVLFDKDGTLLDFQRTWGPWAAEVVDTLAKGDGALAGRLAVAWGLDPANKRVLPGSVLVAETNDQIVASIADLLPEMAQADLIKYLGSTGAKVVGVPVLPLPGFMDDLAALGLASGIATNDNEVGARAQLRALGVEHRFDFIAGYDSGYGAKPAPGMCLAFAEHLRLAPETVVMVGDSVHDLAAGRAAGMQTVAVLTGVAGASDLAPLADIVLTDIGELPDWIAE